MQLSFVLFFNKTINLLPEDLLSLRGYLEAR
jgi:hypothetical protein